MYCIIRRGMDKQYIAFQDTGYGIQNGYFFTGKETFLMNLPNNKADHPTVFKTRDEAVSFIGWLRSSRHCFSGTEFSLEWIENDMLPKCDMDCFKCNKRNKHRCRNLRNPYQNHCGFIMAKFDDDFVPDKKRLDAHCEKCLTTGCRYNMNWS